MEQEGVNEIAQVGVEAPAFRLRCASAGGAVTWRTNADYHGEWLMLIFYPRDNSFVCPTELTAFSGRMDEFRKRGCSLLGISVDTLDSHLEWLKAPVDRGGVGPLRFPLAADEEGRASRAYGVWNRHVEVANRGLFLIDPAGRLQYAVVHALSVGRGVEEVLRVLDALRTGGICPSSWTSADGTLDVERMLRTGRVLGHYRIERELGRGSFASVFSAWDLRLERWVALKVLRRARSDSDADILAEARSAASINHPHVCAVHAVDEIDGLPVIVMELLEGETLAQAIRRGLPADRTRTLASGIAEGLAAAHARGVVHGDLKPANVLLVEGTRPVIVDFGLAHTRRPRETASTTAAGVTASVSRSVQESLALDATTVLPQSAPRMSVSRDAAPHLEGTPAYMAPEQSLGQASVPASDIFAFGLLLFEMLTGERALMGESLGEVFQRLGNPEFAAATAARVDAPWRPLIHDLLRPEPESRPAAKDLVSHLAELRTTDGLRMT